MFNENCITTGQRWLFSKKKIKLTHRYYSRDLPYTLAMLELSIIILFITMIYMCLFFNSVWCYPPPQTLHDSESDQREITLIHCYCLQYDHAKQCDFNLLYMKNFFCVSIFSLRAPYLLNKVRNIIIVPCVPVYDSW